MHGTWQPPKHTLLEKAAGLEPRNEGQQEPQQTAEKGQGPGEVKKEN